MEYVHHGHWACGAWISSLKMARLSLKHARDLAQHVGELWGALWIVSDHILGTQHPPSTKERLGGPKTQELPYAHTSTFPNFMTSSTSCKKGTTDSRIHVSLHSKELEIHGKYNLLWFVLNILYHWYRKTMLTMHEECVRVAKVFNYCHSWVWFAYFLYLPCLYEMPLPHNKHSGNDQ